MNAPSFENRWFITGTLTTTSELHIGDGGAGEIHDRARPADKARDESDASTVCVDHRDRACVPASAIKGVLRALLPRDANGKLQAPWEELFGSDKPDEESAQGGRLEFWDGFHCGGKGDKTHQPDPDRLYEAPDRGRPWWNNDRKTCVAVSVSLDRATRSARENLLYHLEYVPPGEGFRFGIGGDNIKEEYLKEFLALLGRFNDGSAALGAQTTNGWGRVRCAVESVKCLTRAGLDGWKRNPTPGCAAAATVPPGFEDPDALLSGQAAGETLLVGIRLVTDSPWLIRDPRQRERSLEGRHLPEGQRPGDAMPVVDESARPGVEGSGKPFVPAKSLRGALRSRAEMILRTVGIQRIKDHPADIDPVTTKGRTTKNVIDEIAAMSDLAAKLFGFGGWQGTVKVPRLTSGVPVGTHAQEFVAIDRFTGGAAEGAKFDATLADAATLEGTLAIDLARLGRVDPALASLGLLALVLRDLAEGDIPVGSGSAKGQGLCHASITWNGKDLFDPGCEASLHLEAFHKSISTPPTP